MSVQEEAAFTFEGHSVKFTKPQIGDRIIFSRNMETMMYSDSSIYLKQGVIISIREDVYGRPDKSLYFIMFDGEDTGSGYYKSSFRVLA